MTIPKLHLRDLFWLTLVVGLALGWWLDQHRLRRREQKIARISVAKLMSLSRTLELHKSELATAIEANQKSAGTVPANEMQRMNAAVGVAQADLEQAIMTMDLHYGQ